MKTSILAVASVAAAMIAAWGCTSLQEKPAADTLVAAKVTKAPVLAAGADDPAWGAARPLKVELTAGANFGAARGATAGAMATLKAVYADDTLYLLIQYRDPTNSTRRQPYQKQADGSWKKLVDPDDKGGDENVYYEDKWAMIWPIGNSIKAFEKQGCAYLCHEEKIKPYGNKYTRFEGEIADMWHMKGSRTAPLGFVDDQYVDHTRYDKEKSPNAGRKSDPGTPGGEYNAIPLVGGKPQFMNRDGRPLNAGGTTYIKRGDEMAFDDSRFKTGDEVASYIINPLQGDRADIRVAMTWRDGLHTSVVSRKLVTGSKFDVQFADLGARYAFGIAAFDNAQVRHATSDDTLFLVFGK